MAILDIVTLPGTCVTLKLETNEVGEAWVCQYFNGEFWDAKDFDTVEAARAFMADPFKSQREVAAKREARQQEKDLAEAPYYARDYVKIETGKRIGRK